jgi:hypothetical protein
MISKNIDKICKILGDETTIEMGALSDEDIKQRIIAANSAMKQVRDELEANPKYQDIKEDLKALTAGKKEVDKRQKAVIAYALHLLEASDHE